MERNALAAAAALGAVIGAGVSLVCGGQHGKQPASGAAAAAAAAAGPTLDQADEVIDDAWQLAKLREFEVRAGVTMPAMGGGAGRSVSGSGDWMPTPHGLTMGDALLADGEAASHGLGSLAGRVVLELGAVRFLNTGLCDHSNGGMLTPPEPGTCRGWRITRC